MTELHTVHPNLGGGFSQSPLKEDKAGKQDQQSRAMKVRGRATAISPLKKWDNGLPVKYCHYDYL